MRELLQTVLSSVRDQLAVVARRREDLDRQRVDLDREYARLAAAVSVMEEHAGAAGQPSSTDPLADPSSLTERILDALAGSSATSRADLLSLFRPLGVNDNTLDSAVYRLRKRGTIEKRGKYFFLPSVSSDVPPGGSDLDRHRADPGPAGADAALEPAPFVGGVPALDDRTRGTLADLPSAPADERPLTHRVREAVATLAGPTRAVLVRYFAAQGVKAASVDTAVSGLRKRGQLERRPDGAFVVFGSDAPSVPADAASQGS